MKICALLLSSLALVPSLVHAQTTGPCPRSAVFLALESEVRGYSTRANGAVAPCQVLQGALTTLSTANSLSFAHDGSLHILQFLTNGTVAVFTSDATGNVAPQRLESTYTNDLIALATDTRDVDFVLSRRSGPATIIVVLPGQTTPAFSLSIPEAGQSAGLSIDTDNNLVVGGYDQNYNPVVATLNSSAPSATALRAIYGSNTGLYSSNFQNFGSNAMSLAVDPISGELYVYNYSPATGDRQISVFAPRASGDVQPTRVIRGAATQIGGPGQLNSKIAVSADGRLYVAEANNQILVFAPGVSGNVAPSQIIIDSTTAGQTVAQGGIGVRSCSCQ